MTFEPEATGSGVLAEPPFQATGKPGGFRNLFIGSGGIRAGWRLLIYLAMVMAFRRSVQFAIGHIPPIRDWIGLQNNGVVDAGPQILIEFILVLAVFLPALVMSKIEARPFYEYGLAVAHAFGRRFWQGISFGFAMVSLLMFLIAAFHGYSIDGIGTSAGQAIRYGLLYAVGFLLVGLFEEFGFRGYMQYTLASGIGFWPAAVVISVLFGAAHLENPGEARIGAFMAGSFGLLALFTLRRTGSLWFAVGVHAAFDWTQTFVYGVADSGLTAQGHLLNSSFHGPDWLTGGSIGPEGSYCVFAVLILSAMAIHFMLPVRQQGA